MVLSSVVRAVVLAPLMAKLTNFSSIALIFNFRILRVVGKVRYFDVFLCGGLLKTGG